MTREAAVDWRVFVKINDRSILQRFDVGGSDNISDGFACIPIFYSKWNRNRARAVSTVCAKSILINVYKGSCFTTDAGRYSRYSCPVSNQLVVISEQSRLPMHGYHKHGG